jgi:tetratricopeptide (TPR) repeat protein
MLVMRHTKAVITSCFVIALSASARPAVGQGRSGLEAVKDLYESAAYEEALATLDRLDNETLQKSSVAQTARQYRALCLIALDRPSDAEHALEDMVRGDPKQPAPDIFPPRVVAMFGRVRERLLPAIALEQYATAKLSFDRKDYPAALTGFDRLTALLADPSLSASTNATLDDIRTLAKQFQQLARVSVSPTPAPDNAGRPPQPTVPEAAPSVPPAPQPATSAIATPAPNPSTEEAAIRALLQAYAGAYSARQADAVARLFPGVDERALKQSFSAAKSMQVLIRDERFLSVTSTEATVSCTWDTVFVGPVGSAQRQTQKITLRLQKSGGAWIIVDRR